MTTENYMQLFLWAGGLLTGLLAFLLMVWRRDLERLKEAIARLDRVVFNVSDEKKVRLASIHQLNNYRQEVISLVELIRPLCKKYGVEVPEIGHMRELRLDE